MATSATISKELAQTLANVDAAPAAKPTKKAASKPATKAAAKPAAKAAPKATSAKKAGSKAKTVPSAYGLRPFFRPASGRLLQCHTQAVLEFFGLLDKNGKAAKRDLRNVMGDTAVNYHLRFGVENFVEKDGMVSLSSVGRTVFGARADAFNDNDRATVAAYLNIFRTGKIDGKLVKDKDAIVNYKVA